MSQLRPDRVNEPVAGPQVAVQPRRRFGGATDLSKTVRVEAGEPEERALGDGSRVTSEPRERGHPLRRVERGPVGAWLVRQAPTARRATVLAAERRRAGRVERCERATEPAVRLRRGSPFLDPLQYEERRIIGDRQHLRHRHHARLTQPPQPGRLGGEEAVRRVRMGLREDPAPVGELDRERRGDVSSMDARRADDAHAERLRDVVGKIHPASRLTRQRRDRQPSRCPRQRCARRPVHPSGCR